MIHAPQSKGDHDWCRAQFAKFSIQIGEDGHFITWIRNDAPVWFVAYDGWLGRTCQMHMVGFQTFVPRALRKAAFDYAFGPLARTRVFGIVNSLKTHVLRLDLFLGFKEILRFPGDADDGGDIVLLQMTADEWKAKNGNR